MSTIFTDNFNRSDRDLNGDNGWTASGVSAFTITSNEVVYGGTTNWCSNSVTLGTNDYKVTVDINPDTQWGEVCARWDQGTGSGYAVYYIKNYGIGMHRRDNAAFAGLGTDYLDASLTGYHTITIEVNGNQISAYLDGTLRDSDTDNTYASGQPGLAGPGGGGAKFDNLVVEDLVTTTTSTTSSSSTSSTSTSSSSTSSTSSSSSTSSTSSSTSSTSSSSSSSTLFFYYKPRFQIKSEEVKINFRK